MIPKMNFILILSSIFGSHLLNAESFTSRYFAKFNPLKISISEKGRPSTFEFNNNVLMSSYPEDQLSNLESALLTLNSRDEFIAQIKVENARGILCALSEGESESNEKSERGHASLLVGLYETSESKLIEKFATYGFWPDHLSLGVRIAGNLQENHPKDDPYRFVESAHPRANQKELKKSVAVFCLELEEAGLESVKQALLKKAREAKSNSYNWTLFNNCATFVSEIFKEATTIELPSQNRLGVCVPQKLTDQIKEFKDEAQKLDVDTPN